MKTDWTKIRNKYINSSLSQSEIARKYKVSINSIKKHCVNEGWVELRKEQQMRITEKVSQKTAEKLSEQNSDTLAKVSEATTKLLEAVFQAVNELGFKELQNKRQYKKTKDIGGGEREEKTETKEYLERVECMIDMNRVQNITAAIKTILEINALLSGKEAEDDSLESLIEAIKGIEQ